MSTKLFATSRSFLTSKTTWTGILAILGAIASCLASKETFGQAEQQAVVALIGMFVRDTIAKGVEEPAQSS